VLFGQTRYKDLHRFDVILVNYDVLQYHLDALKKADLRSVFIDECQMTKNPKAQRTKAVLKVCKGARHIIPMSGTPIINRPVEFWNMLNLIKPSVFNNYFRYVRRYCDAKSNGFALDVNGASNTEELHQILQSIMIRRLKSEVLPELPPKVYDIVPLEIDRREYDLAMNEFSTWIDEHPDNPATAMVRMEKAKQAATHGKLKAAIEWIEDFLEDGSKLVLFGWHIDVLDKLEKHFKKRCVRIQGTPQEKQRAIDAFQNEAWAQLALANMQAAGDSIDLTAANDVGFIELPWTPTDLEQCEDRCYGRLNDLHGATIHFLAAMDTIEIKMAELLVSKSGVVSSVIDGDDASDSILHQLLQQYRRK
jgi:SWI/SNF-related matrix-associated actin-dependent regulator 1 of chromatin subfamily A